MDRIIRPVARQLLRPRPRYPFKIPPAAYGQRLYTMGHSAPQVRSEIQRASLLYTDTSILVERSIAVH